ncbi:class Ib ribonucleoside-diphosphate reductase assembly flavoprotein NrdI [Tatumella punctata]|uniref:Protein NrdI n=1 Tax=Tatumella punctata TaxID=399969 RepID=A0ABW1VS62_9GAMM
MFPLIYFSSRSENTHRFVQRLGLEAYRIPLDNPVSFAVTRPFLLVVPSYGGGEIRGSVPRQVIHFLNNPDYRKYLCGVIGTGNRNFGAGYCLAAKIIARKCAVPCISNTELLGTTEDLINVRRGVEKLWQQYTQP